jgi:tripeptide aminopeptidase
LDSALFYPVCEFGIDEIAERNVVECSFDHVLDVRKLGRACDKLIFSSLEEELSSFSLLYCRYDFVVVYQFAVRIGFNPDEEIGLGAHKFDVAKFGCEWAYTMDGGEVGELEFENFNAAGAKITFKGRNVHPGYAKNKMINSMLVANQFIQMLPAEETPAHTEGYEGFYHLIGINGEVEQTTASYIIRDHDRERFEARKQFITDCVNKLNEQWGETVAVLEMRDQYYNMRQQIEPVMHIIDIAFEAMEAVGVKPHVKAIRGGTDGAQLSFKGLPCPNIFAGGLNFHGRYEFLPIQNMQKAMNVVVKIAELTAQKS